MRMLGKFDVSFSRSASLDAATAHCILDWPEQTQTSPTKISLISTTLEPLIVSLIGLLLAFMDGSFVSQ